MTMPIRSGTQMNKTEAIEMLESAGKYLVKSRNLRSEVERHTAISAASHANPDMQAFAVLSIALAHIVGQHNQEWVRQAKEILKIDASPELKKHFILFDASTDDFNNDQWLTEEELRESNANLRATGSNYRWIPYRDYESASAS